MKRDVAAGLIMCDGLMLIAQRKHGKSLEYKWEFPGGKLEEGETLEERLAREMMEELGLEVCTHIGRLAPAQILRLSTSTNNINGLRLQNYRNTILHLRISRLLQPCCAKRKNA